MLQSRSYHSSGAQFWCHRRLYLASDPKHWYRCDLQHHKSNFDFETPINSTKFSEPFFEWVPYICRFQPGRNWMERQTLDQKEVVVFLVQLLFVSALLESFSSDVQNLSLTEVIKVIPVVISIGVVCWSSGSSSGSSSFSIGKMMPSETDTIRAKMKPYARNGKAFPFIFSLASVCYGIKSSLFYLSYSNTAS